MQLMVCISILILSVHIHTHARTERAYPYAYIDTHTSTERVSQYTYIHTHTRTERGVWRCRTPLSSTTCSGLPPATSCRFCAINGCDAAMYGWGTAIYSCDAAVFGCLPGSNTAHSSLFRPTRCQYRNWTQTLPNWTVIAAIYKRNAAVFGGGAVPFRGPRGAVYGANNACYTTFGSDILVRPFVEAVLALGRVDAAVYGYNIAKSRDRKSVTFTFSITFVRVSLRLLLCVCLTCAGPA
eukprot:1293414-Rhodomonas_salina.1